MDVGIRLPAASAQLLALLMEGKGGAVEPCGGDGSALIRVEVTSAGGRSARKPRASGRAVGVSAPGKGHRGTRLADQAIDAVEIRVRVIYHKKPVATSDVTTPRVVSVPSEGAFRVKSLVSACETSDGGTPASRLFRFLFGRPQRPAPRGEGQHRGLAFSA